MRAMNAFTVLLFGLGVLVFVAGVFTDAYDWKIGVVGAVALWVLAVTLRVYTFSRDEDEEFGHYEPRRLYDRY
jgi:prepilin signal peptidase PulO-like enzyme (type II secretory pathway)